MSSESVPDIFGLPVRIRRLGELAYNLWWSWHEEARQIFRSLDYAQWRTSGHNPVRQLRQMSPEKLRSAAADPAFLEQYDSVMGRFDAALSENETWFHQSYGAIEGPIAYFSAEYAIHASLPIYAGGLGVLAGDICKEASDLGFPLAAVGFMYPQGYFHQHLNLDGWQQEAYEKLDFSEAPISSCPWPEGCGDLVTVPLGGKNIYVAVWLVRVGRTNLYLLDTNVEQNSPGDRVLSARLYGSDQEERMRQLMLLGMGGVRTLRQLQIGPQIWHANEDHTVFMMLERLREEVEKGADFEEARRRVSAATVFTTHTPVPAGHNSFSYDLMDRYCRGIWESLHIDRGTFLELGRHPGLDPGRFSLTALALRLSSRANAVSALHGMVTRRMWHVLWPERPLEDTPITHVTNGVHLPTWQAPEMRSLCQKYLGNGSPHRQESPEFWRCIEEIPDEELWEVRQSLKIRLIRQIQDRAQQRWVEDGIPTQQVLALGALLDPYPLTIVFARRFTEYKRPGLLAYDPERLKRILTNPAQPVQIIFAGKSHPADHPSKQLLQQVYRLAIDRSFQGRIAFVEEYDMHLSRDMVRGADVWLNTPRRLQEACGTSGMKAAMNGVLNFSVPDGWWAEGYSGTNGWSIGIPGERGREDEYRADAQAIYDLLEKEIIPLYFDRDRQGVPHGWIRMAKEAIKSISPTFSASRMLKDYARQMYLPALVETRK